MSFNFSVVTTDVTDAHILLEKAWADAKRVIGEVSQDTELHVELAIRAAGTLIKRGHLGKTQQVTIAGHAAEPGGVSNVAISITEQPAAIPEVLLVPRRGDLGTS
jgi:hypothetical protein